MHLTIDHVTIAAADLAAIRATFTQLGLATDYGGPHSNGITHMDLLGFQDGSYIELISSLTPNPPDTAFWSQYITQNGGPCAWAIQVANVVAEAQRVAALNILVIGPTYYHRRRPDGVLVEWDLAFLGEDGAGATIPFIIKDITPRDLRVQPSASVSSPDCPLSGVGRVVLAVTDLNATSQLFQHLYNWPAPRYESNDSLQATLAAFPNTPVILASPTNTNSWLGQRLTQFGPSPCAYLLKTSDFNAAQQHYPLTKTETWFNQPIAWFDSPQLHSLMLGVVA
jgi:hypothetical protein